MAGRLAASVCIVTLVLAGALLLEAPVSWADIPEGAVEFQDGAGNPVASITSAQRAFFYVRDPGLTTVPGATAPGPGPRSRCRRIPRGVSPPALRTLNPTA